MSANSLARNGVDLAVVPLITGFVGSGPLPAILSKNDLMVLEIPGTGPPSLPGLGSLVGAIVLASVRSILSLVNLVD